MKHFTKFKLMDVQKKINRYTNIAFRT